MKNKYKHFFINLIFPAFIFGSITGALTGAVVTVYKFCAKHVIHYSEIGYGYIREHLYFIPLAVIALFGIAYLFTLIYKKNPDAKGGGIPSSIAILRGIITFKWLRTLLGVFFLSMTNFLLGVPLGNEGSSVLMGTAVGRGSTYFLDKKHRAWGRYSMTGGACAGFAVATGAPISGVLFAVEEAHGRVSPMIIIVSCVAVLFARIVTELLSPLLGVSISLFPDLTITTLTLKDIWLPLVIGVVLGLFAVAFLYCYRFINKLFNKVIKRIAHVYKIFCVLLLTLILGLCSYSFISTGHELILSLYAGNFAIIMLVIILLVRTLLTLSANTNRLTGGIFLPILALGALISAILGKGMNGLFGLDQSYYTVILALGITACISGMMKMPLTAIIFAVEALSCHNNVLYVIIVSAVAFVITEIFSAKSINDSVIDNTIEENNLGKTATVIDTFVTVQKGAFATGKQIRDIFWPANLFVLSVTPSKTRRASVDEHGAKELHEGDILHVRYSTFDLTATKEELIAIVGEQDYAEEVSQNA